MRDSFSRRRFLAVAGAAGASLSILPRRSLFADVTRRSAGANPLALGLQSYTLREFPVEKAIDLAKELGFAHVEFTRKHISPDTRTAELDAVKRKMADLNLRISAQGVNPFTKDHAANRRVFELAKRLGNRNISADPSEDSFDSLERLVAEYDLRIAIHNHGPGSRYDKIADVLKAVKGRDPRIGACATSDTTSARPKTRSRRSPSWATGSMASTSRILPRRRRMPKALSSAAGISTCWPCIRPC